MATSSPGGAGMFPARRPVSSPSLALALWFAVDAAIVGASWLSGRREGFGELAAESLFTISLLAGLALFPLALVALAFGAVRRRAGWLAAGALATVLWLAAMWLGPAARRSGEAARFASDRGAFERLVGELRRFPALREISLGGSLNGSLLPDAPSNDLLVQPRMTTPLSGRAHDALAAVGIDSAAFRRLHYDMARLGISQAIVSPRGVFLRSREPMGWSRVSDGNSAVPDSLGVPVREVELRPLAPGWYRWRVSEGDGD